MDVQRLQVLVVASDPALLAAVGEILTEANVGADLLHAGDPAAALVFLHPDALGDAPRPDVLLLDVDLGDGAVAAMLEPLAADDAFRRLPVVALADDPDAAASQLAGRRIHELLGKPVAGDELLRVLSYFDEA